MKITTWNVNQFCGNDEWAIIKKLKTHNFIKDKIWEEIIKEPLINKVASFLKSDDDLLFLNEVPTGEIFKKFKDECEKMQIKILEPASDINDGGEQRHFKTIALFKGNNYEYAFGDNKDKYFKYMDDKFKWKATYKDKEPINGNDIGRVIFIKKINSKEYFIGMHIASSTYGNSKCYQQPKQFIQNLSKLINEIKKDNKDCEIICCGDTNIYSIYNKNKDTFEDFLKNCKLEDAWTKENKYKYDDEKGRTHKYEVKRWDKKKCTKYIEKNRVDRILISESFMCDYKFYVDGEWVDGKNYDSEHNNYIIDSSIGFEYSDHYPISIEI